MRCFGTHPQDVVALNNLAWLYHQRGDARALDWRVQAVKLAPQSSAVADTLGWILVESRCRGRGPGDTSQAASGPEAIPKSATTTRRHWRDRRDRQRRGEARGIVDGRAKFPSRAEAEELLLSQLAGASAEAT